MEDTLIVEGAICGQGMEVQMRVDPITKPLGHDHQPHSQIVPAQAGLVELVGHLHHRTTQTGEQLAVSVKRAAQVPGQHEDHLAVPRRLDHLVDDETAEDLSPFLPARRGLTPQSRQEKAISCLWRQSPQRIRANPSAHGMCRVSGPKEVVAPPGSANLIFVPTRKPIDFSLWRTYVSI